jgi:hypothetical protein
MTRIVRTTYRYRRPPRKRQAVALEVPAVVKAADPARASKQGRGSPPAPANDGRTPTPPLAAEKKPAIVSIRRRGRFGYAEDLTPEELRRRADAADALFRDIVRRIAETT